MTSAGPTSSRRIIGLVGVYDADSTLRGELTYWIGARLGRRHCSLCEITHGSIRQRPAWKQCQAGLPLPFDTFHRNDQPASIRAATYDQAPVVVAVTDDGSVLLLSPAELAACDGSIELLVAAIEHATDRLDLVWASK